MAGIDSLPVPLSGGPKLARAWLDTEAPSRSTVWRHIRELRHKPPGRARKGQRREVFCAALEQAEQLFAAAEVVGDASRPLLLFYGMSQAGRAIAAASTAVNGNHYRLVGHGITVRNLGQKRPLHELTVADEGDGSFIQLAMLLRSGTLPVGATIGEIWSSIPSLLGQPVDDGNCHWPPLRFEATSVPGILGTRPEIHGWVHGLPAHLAAAADPTQAVNDFLSMYPALAQSSQSGLVPTTLSPDTWQAGAMRALRSWVWPGPVNVGAIRQFLKEIEDRWTLPYLGDDDRWVFPRLGGPLPLHPLLAWWALLFALSMIGRYEPASWTRYLDVDSQPTAVMLGTALSLAMDTCPQLILHTVRAVGK